MRFLVAALMLAACASPEHRIRRNPELFASFPPEVQEMVRAGRVEPGFTPEMVRMAWGQPDRTYQRRTAAGVQEVWGYGSRSMSGSGVGVSVGAAGGSGSGVYGGGITLGGGSSGYGDRRRVVFEGGVVAAVEE